jgi:8-oxo-dGTP pyrophosphatase MutT (NUDIX family)
MKISCGIIIINELNEIFLAHSTGNDFFDIPKGLLEENELPINCAIRECFEETSILLKEENVSELGLFPYNKEKNLHLFYTKVKKANILIDKLVCSSFFKDYYTQQMRPEADFFKWIDINEIEGNCAKSMEKLLTHIKSKNLLSNTKLIISDNRF